MVLWAARGPKTMSLAALPGKRQWLFELHFGYVQPAVTSVEDTNLGAILICDRRLLLIKYHIQSMVAYVTYAHERSGHFGYLEGRGNHVNRV